MLKSSKTKQFYQGPSNMISLDNAWYQAFIPKKYKISSWNRKLGRKYSRERVWGEFPLAQPKPDMAVKPCSNLSRNLILCVSSTWRTVTTTNLTLETLQEASSHWCANTGPLQQYPPMVLHLTLIHIKNWSQLSLLSLVTQNWATSFQTTTACRGREDTALLPPFLYCRLSEKEEVEEPHFQLMGGGH